MTPPDIYVFYIESIKNKNFLFLKTGTLGIVVRNLYVDLILRVFLINLGKFLIRFRINKWNFKQQNAYSLINVFKLIKLNSVKGIVKYI